MNFAGSFMCILRSVRAELSPARVSLERLRVVQQLKRALFPFLPVHPAICLSLSLSTLSVQLPLFNFLHHSRLHVSPSLSYLRPFTFPPPSSRSSSSTSPPGSLCRLFLTSSACHRVYFPVVYQLYPLRLTCLPLPLCPVTPR